MNIWELKTVRPTWAPVYITGSSTLGDLMPRLWPPNILEGHFPSCEGTLATCWHVVLKEVQNSSVGFLHRVVYPALSFVNSSLLLTSLNDSYSLIPALSKNMLVWLWLSENLFLFSPLFVHSWLPWQNFKILGKSKWPRPSFVILICLARPLASNT